MSTSLRIDSHQHFWLLERGDYDWIDSSQEVLYRDYQPAELSSLLAAAGIDKTILVQAAATISESQYLLSLADRYDFIVGVVGWIDMDSNGASEQLAELARHPKLVGIRPLIQDIADPDWMLQGALHTVFEQLIERQLCFDALVMPVHLDNLITLLARYPKLKVVVDHGAKPDIANNAFEPWAQKMHAIASNSDAYCKLSGLLTEAATGAGAAELLPYMQHLLDCFGPQRLMWGSDWPVLNLANDYPGWLEISTAFLAPLDEQEKSAIFGGNAARFYQLELSQ